MDMINQIRNLFLSNWKICAFFAFLFIILLFNTVHNSYPDEFDNILGGRLILKGILPYSGFFSHHGSMGYFFAAVINLFAGQSFVRFRFLMSIVYLTYFIAVYFLVKKKTKSEFSNTFLLFSILIVLASTYFWGHMFLADPLSAMMVLPAYALLFFRMYKNQALNSNDLITISVFSALTSLVSTTFIFLSAVVSGVTLIYYLKQQKIKIDRLFLNKIAKFAFIFSLPYLFFVFFLIISGSIKDFIFDAITYNSKYYIYNYPREPGSGSFINPVRYAIVILNNFLNNYQVQLTGIKYTDFMNPFNLTLAVSNLLLWVTLLWKRKYLLFVLSFFALVYATVRSNPLTSGPTDYQSSVYIYLTFFNAAFSLTNITKFEEKDSSTFTSFSKFAFITLVVYWIFNTMFFGMELWRITYNRYMGKLPLIYDRPQVAPIINAVLSPNEYCWVGPFQFEELYYLNCKQPSKYQWILPQFAQSQMLMDNIIHDYSKNKPAIIVYQRGYSAFGQSPAYSNFFVDFLEKNYVRLKNFEPNLTFKDSITKDFNLNEDFNFKKSEATDLIARLQKTGYIVTK